VAHGGGLADAEDVGDLQRVGAAGDGVIELPVHAQPFEGGGQAAQDPVEPGQADRAEAQCAFPAEQQVWVGGVRPASASVVEPVVQDAVGQLVHGPVFAGDAQASVAQVDVVQLQVADFGVSGGGDGGQRDRDSGVQAVGGLDGRGDLLCGQGLRDRVLGFAD